MNQYTLITGASSGIGLELAKLAAKDGRNLLLVARDPDGLKNVKKELVAIDSTIAVDTIALDLSKSDSAQKLFQHCQKHSFYISELINNAGFGDYGVFADSDLQRQLTMINLNIRTLTELTHLFLPEMLEQRSGRIMNVGSIASFSPGPLMSVYFATKNYVLAFSEAIAEELRGSGVSVTCLCPGSTKTNFGKNAHVSETHSTASPKTTAADVAQFGWYHMNRGTAVAVYGFGNRASIFLASLLPRSIRVKLIKRIQK
jgi:short-subunit dehydrogenase